MLPIEEILVNQFVPILLGSDISIKDRRIFLY